MARVLAPLLRTVGGGLGGSLLLCQSPTPSCDAAQDAQLRQSRATTQSAISAVGSKHLIGYIWAFGGLGIVTILAMSMRSGARSERALSAIAAAEKVLAKNSAVRASAGGPVYAAGSFQLGTGSMFRVAVSSGWFDASASGGVKGRVWVEGGRSSRNGPWEFSYMRVVLDRTALAARNADRRSHSVAAGYMSQADADAANALEAAALADPLAAASSEGAAPELAGVEYPAPGLVAVQVIGSPVEHEMPDFSRYAAAKRAR